MNKFIKKIAGPSLLYGIILVLIFLFAYTSTPSKIFPNNLDWNLILGIYVGTFALALIGVYALDRKILTGLAEANYWKSFLTRFLPKAILYSIILILIKTLIKGPGSTGVLQAISNIPVGILIVHLFVVSQVEEIIFGGFIYTTIEKRSGSRRAQITSTILFALWHLAKTGGNIIIMLTYVPLRLWWNYERNFGTPGLNKLLPQFFGGSRQTQQANAGSHFAWNLFIVGFIEPFAV